MKKEGMEGSKPQENQEDKLTWWNLGGVSCARATLQRRRDGVYSLPRVLSTISPLPRPPSYPSTSMTSCEWYWPLTIGNSLIDERKAPSQPLTFIPIPGLMARWWLLLSDRSR